MERITRRPLYLKRHVEFKLRCFDAAGIYNYTKVWKMNPKLLMIIGEIAEGHESKTDFLKKNKDLRGLVDEICNNWSKYKETYWDELSESLVKR